MAKKKTTKKKAAKKAPATSHQPPAKKGPKYFSKRIKCGDGYVHILADASGVSMNDTTTAPLRPSNVRSLIATLNTAINRHEGFKYWARKAKPVAPSKPATTPIPSSTTDPTFPEKAEQEGAS